MEDLSNGVSFARFWKISFESPPETAGEDGCRRRLQLARVLLTWIHVPAYLSVRLACVCLTMLACMKTDDVC